MSEFVVNGDMFGRYVRIPTDFSKAMHVYKVVSRIDSNGYCDTPITYRTEQTVHPEIVPVLKVIHCGIDETKVIRVALADCELVPMRADGCDWCTNMGDYDRFEFYRIDHDGHTEAHNHMVSSAVAEHCPKCGRRMEESQ